MAEVAGAGGEEQTSSLIWGRLGQQHWLHFLFSELLGEK